MDKKNWGSKRICECGKKFYDFNKNPIICPCGKVQTFEDKFAKLATLKQSENKKSLDESKPEDLVEDAVIDENKDDDTVVSLEAEREIEENLEKEKEQE